MKVSGLFAAYQVVVAVRVYAAEISRVQPTFPQSARRGSGIVVIAFHDVGSSDQDFSRLAYSAITVNQAIPWIAHDAGHFKKHGLDVELHFIEGGAKAV